MSIKEMWGTHTATQKAILKFVGSVFLVQFIMLGVTIALLLQRTK